MITTGTNETLQEGLYNEWLNNLSMYSQELEHLSQLATKTNYKGIQPDAAIELDALKDLIAPQQKMLHDFR